MQDYIDYSNASLGFSLSTLSAVLLFGVEMTFFGKIIFLSMFIGATGLCLFSTYRMIKSLYNKWSIQDKLLTGLARMRQAAC